MATKHAKYLDHEHFQILLMYIYEISRMVERDIVFVMLSYFAGLRACEIAGLNVSAVCDPGGNIGPTLTVFSHTTKNGRERTIPIHPDLHKAIERFLYRYPDASYFAISPRGGRMSRNAVVLWFFKAYRAAKLIGCSSHSGRRSFITNLARRANQHDSSLVDVQRLAGHARLDTTEAYIAPSRTTTNLVHSIGKKKRRTPAKWPSRYPGYEDYDDA